MQIVNGYVCMNCCDIDKARLGQDPHQSADQLKKQVERYLAPSTLENFGPAVLLGGSLQVSTTPTHGGGPNASLAAYGGTPTTQNTTASAVSSIVDLLA